MRPNDFLATIVLLGPLLMASGCPTKMIYFPPDGGTGGEGGEAGSGARRGGPGGAGVAGAAGLAGTGGVGAGGTTGTGGAAGGTAGLGGIAAGGGAGTGGAAGGTAGLGGTATGGRAGTGGAAGMGGVSGAGGAAGVGGAGGVGGCTATQGVIDFEDLATTRSFAPVSLPYVYGDFSLSTQDPDGLSAVGSKATQYLNTTALVANYTATIVLTRNGGKPFSLLGIDLSPYNDSHPGIVYSFVGQKSDGSTVSQDVSLRNQGRGFVPYALPASFEDLLSVTWTMNMADTALYFDNIRYSFCPGS